MTDAKMKELKNLFNSIEMFDEANGVNEMVADRDYLMEEITYLQQLRKDAAQARDTTAGDEHIKYTHKCDVLTKILEIFYLFA